MAHLDGDNVDLYYVDFGDSSYVSKNCAKVLRCVYDFFCLLLQQIVFVVFKAGVVSGELEQQFSF